MGQITLGGNLPNMDQHNGLSVIEDELIRDPSKRQVAVIYLDAQKLTTKVDDGEISPTLRIRRIEVATEEADVKELVEIIDRLSQDRLGMLPIEGPADDDDAGEGGENDDDTTARAAKK